MLFNTFPHVAKIRKHPQLTLRKMSQQSQTRRRLSNLFHVKTLTERKSNKALYRSERSFRLDFIFYAITCAYVLSEGVSSVFRSDCSSFNSWLSLPVLCTLYGNTGLAIFLMLPTRTNSSKPRSSNLKGNKERFLKPSPFR